MKNFILFLVLSSIFTLNAFAVMECNFASNQSGTICAMPMPGLAGSIVLLYPSYQQETLFKAKKSFAELVCNSFGKNSVVRFKKERLNYARLQATGLNKGQIWTSLTRIEKYHPDYGYVIKAKLLNSVKSKAKISVMTEVECR